MGAGLCTSTGLFSQSSTTYRNDSIEIRYDIKGKKGVIKELHKIPIVSYRIPEAPVIKRAKLSSDVIKLESLNYHLLDSLVWVECNVYRQSKGLSPVKWNDTIYWASSHHSEYQCYFNLIGHGEKDSMPGREKEQLHYRTLFPTGAEICLMRHFTEGKDTYDKVAKEIIDQWKKSPGHNKIMITPKYRMNAFGCAFRYNVSHFITRENMLRYNPELLKKIESVLPDYFKVKKQTTDISIQLHSTGNFNEHTNIHKEMEWIRKAKKTVNPDGSVTYTTSTGGPFPPKEKVKTTDKKKRKKKKRK